jgi:hypothetical protein
MVQWQNARTWNLHLGQRGQVSVVDVVAMQVWQVEGEHRPVCGRWAVLWQGGLHTDARAGLCVRTLSLTTNLHFCVVCMSCVVLHL